MNAGDVAPPGLASRDCDHFTLSWVGLNRESLLGGPPDVSRPPRTLAAGSVFDTGHESLILIGG